MITIDNHTLQYHSIYYLSTLGDSKYKITTSEQTHFSYFSERLVRKEEQLKQFSDFNSRLTSQTCISVTPYFQIARKYFLTHTL